MTPAKRGQGKRQAKAAANNWLEKTQEEHRRAMTWMQQLKRVFNIDIETSERCGGKAKAIAGIEYSAVIAHILEHVQQKEVLPVGIQLQERAPPVMGLIDYHFPSTLRAGRNPVRGSAVHAVLFKQSP